MEIPRELLTYVYKARQKIFNHEVCHLIKTYTIFVLKKGINSLFNLAVSLRQIGTTINSVANPIRLGEKLK